MGSGKASADTSKLLQPHSAMHIYPTQFIEAGSFVCMLQVVEVADETISIRSLDWDRDRFDIEFGLQEGTTYNSFLIFGEKTCLVDASHEKFRDLYMNTLKTELEKRGRKLDYVVVSHTEPDHSGNITYLS